MMNSYQQTDYQQRLKRAQELVQAADYLLVGGGAGLSDAAGLKYDGERFREHFGPFIARYGFSDMYSAGFYPFPTEEEKWAYWAQHIEVNRYQPPAAPLYLALRRLVESRDYFVLTTNVDAQFAKAGFAPERIFAVQGDYGLNQCARACHHQLYDNRELVAEMVAQSQDCRIPSSLVPRCPVCGGPMAVNLRIDSYFVEDEAWHAAEHRYRDFLKQASGHKLVLLELGVGFNTPGIIRYPFEQMTYQQPDTRLLRLNARQTQGVKENAAKTICFSEEMAEVIADLLENSSRGSNGRHAAGVDD